MQVSNTNFLHPSFGHSFRVSICLQDEYGVNHFISPADENKLYRNLNSKIVGYLNEDYYTRLGNLYNVKNKRKKTPPKTDVHKQMVEDLKKLDSDYAKFDIVKSVYRKNYLTYIATGIDVPILEHVEGTKDLGIAKSSLLPGCFEFHTEFVKDFAKAVKRGCLNYVKQDNSLLRSPSDKEIMLKAVFKETGTTKAGTPNYELDSYEFHENVTKRTLSPVSKRYIEYKENPSLLNELLKTVQHHSKRLAHKKATFADLKKIFPSLNPAQKSTICAPQSEKPGHVRHVSKSKADKHIQLTFDFKD